MIRYGSLQALNTSITFPLINKHLPKGLAGKTPEDAAKVDMLLESFTDFIIPMEIIYYEKDESRKVVIKYSFRIYQIACHIEPVAFSCCYAWHVALAKSIYHSTCTDITLHVQCM